MFEAQPSRFEFRSFGRDFQAVRRRMADLSAPVPEAVRERRSREVYIVAASNDRTNVKIRDEMLDVKLLLQTVDGLEQWAPSMKAPFPLASEALRSSVFPPLTEETPELEADEYSLERFLSLVRADTALQAVPVSKHRFGFTINDTICEFAEVLIDDVSVSTVAVESTDIERIHRTLRDLHLTELENINYVQAIKRVIGMIDEPLAN